MLKLRTDTVYVAPSGKLVQAGYEALQGWFDEQASRVTTLEGYARRVLLATRTASASATLDFTEFNNAVYRRYEFELENVLPATDDISLFLRTSTNGGSSYDSGASDYQWSLNGMNGTVAASAGSAGAGSVAVTNSTAGNRIGNAAGEYGVNGIVMVFNAGNASSATDIQSRISYFNTATAYSQYSGSGVRAAAADVDALRFLPTSGNITSGTIRMYGLN